MTIRTLVKYIRDCWSWLGTGVEKDKTKFGPSCETPSIPEQKTCGASFPRGMANPLCEKNKSQAGMANLKVPRSAWARFEP